MQLTNEEIARVFAMYWQAKFRYEGSLGTVRTVMGITRGWNITDDTDEDVSYKVNKCKLLLTHLSNISDEDSIEVAKVYTGNIRGDYDNIGNLLEAGRQTAKRMIEGYFNSVKTMDFIFAYQYLISKGYSVPLWFSVGHWANGLTAINLNIAIDKTTQPSLV